MRGPLEVGWNLTPNKKPIFGAMKVGDGQNSGWLHLHQNVEVPKRPRPAFPGISVGSTNLTTRIIGGWNIPMFNWKCESSFIVHVPASYVSLPECIHGKFCGHLWLVGGFKPSWKICSSNWIISRGREKHEMFETTSQIMIQAFNYQ